MPSSWGGCGSTPLWAITGRVPSDFSKARFTEDGPAGNYIPGSIDKVASMGLTVSDAIRVFLTRVVADKELPFAIKAPNASSRAAMVEASEIIKTRRARFANSDALIDDLEKASLK